MLSNIFTNFSLHLLTRKSLTWKGSNWRLPCIKKLLFRYFSYKKIDKLNILHYLYLNGINIHLLSNPLNYSSIYTLINNDTNFYDDCSIFKSNITRF